jgi:hypothetical protein
LNSNLGFVDSLTFKKVPKHWYKAN